MKKSRFLIIAIAIASFLITPTINAAIVTQLYGQNEFSGQYSVINFEGYAHGTAANTLYANQGIEFSNFGATLVPIYDWSDNITTSPDNVIATVGGTNGSQMSTHLDVSISFGGYEVGAFFGNDQFDNFTLQTLSIFDVNDVLLGAVNVTANINTSVDQFIGLRSDIPFYRARFENDSLSLSVVLDDLTYVSAIPVPPAVWLFGSGLIGLIGVARRKKA